MIANSPDREARLDRLWAEYLAAAERGDPPDRAAWLAAHPELSAALGDSLDCLAEVDRRVAPLRMVAAGVATDETVVQPGAGGAAVASDIPAPAGYEILGKIAEGGMGVVYRARELELNRVVALKMIRAGELAGESGVRRFRLEAEAAAGFDHPHIVPVYEVGVTAAGDPFFSMKLVAGRTLTDWLADGWAAGGALHTAAGLREGVRLLATVARAVHFAHQRGFLHRDLKPANVLIDGAGVPYVTDFGLAKRLTESADDPSLTQAGGLVGTLGYMPPEQAYGEKALTTAADVYPLGAILFHLLTGRPLRPVRNLAELYRHLEKPAPRPRTLNPQADRYLEAICLKCLALDPAARFGSAEALADDLDRWARGLPTRTLPPRQLRRLAMWARRRPDIAALSALTLFVLLAGVVLVTWKWRAELAVRRDAQTQASRSAAIVAQGLLEEGHAGDPENADAAVLWWVRSLLAASDGASRESAAARANIAALAGRLHTLREIWQLPAAWSNLVLAPDGRHAAVIVGDGVRLLDPRTGRDVGAGIAHRDVTAIAFSPDGGTLATAGAGGVSLWNLNGQPLPPRTLAVSGGVERLAVGPNGERVAVVLKTLGKEVQLLPDGGPVAGPPTHPLKITAITFNSRGTRLATGCEDKFARVWDVVAREWVGDRLWHDDAVRAVAFSPDGKGLVTGSDDHVGRVWPVGGTGPPVKLEHHDYVQGVAVSPDGRLIATAGADSAVQVWEADTGRRVGQVLKHGSDVRAVGFADDGTGLVMAGGDGVVRVLAVSRSSREERSITVSSPVYAVATGPGGAEVFAGTGHGVFGIDATANELTPQLPEPPGDTGLFAAAGVVAVQGYEVWATTRSLRGGWVAAGGRSADSKGWARVSSANGTSAWTFRFTQPVRSLAFAPNGSRLLITAADAKAGGLWEWNPLAPGTDTWPLLDKEPPSNEPPPVWAVAFSPDGSRYAVSSGYGTVRVWQTARPGEKPLTLPHPWRVGALAFHPDGNRIVTGSTDRHARVWDLTTGERLADFPAHHGAVWAVAVSPDGRLIASAGRDRCVRVWDAETGDPVGAPLHQRTAACTWGVTFGADGSSIYSGNEEGSVRGGEGGSVRRWRTPTTGLDIADPHVEPWAEAVTGLRLDGDRVRVLTPVEWRERRKRLESLCFGLAE